MARGILLQTFQNFSAGINLRSDSFELAANESPDMLNVDIDSRGGIQQRVGAVTQPWTFGNPNLLTDDQATAATSTTGLSTSLCTVARVTGTAHPPAHNAFTIPAVIRATTNGAGQPWVQSYFKPIVAGQRYTQHVNVRYVSGTVVQAIVRMDWYNASNTYMSSTSTTITLTSNQAWVVATATAYPPAGATQVNAIIFFGNGTTNPAVGSAYDIAGHMVAAGQNLSGWMPQAATGFPSSITSWGRYSTALYDHTFVIAASALWWSVTGSNTWHTLGNYTGYARFVQFKDRLYVVSRDNYVVWWNGDFLVALTDGKNDTVRALTDPAFGTGFVVAHDAVVFQGFMFVIVGQDPAGTYMKNRIRWSQANHAQDWRNVDFIDIDIGMENDELVALVALRDRLIIFKRHSIYQLVGTSPENFAVYPISKRIGASHASAVQQVENGVYFWHSQTGVWHFDGNKLDWKFSRLHPLIAENLVPAARGHLVRLGWNSSMRRLYVAVPWRAVAAGDITTNTRVYVLDPALSKEGSWTAYSFTGVSIESFFEVYGHNFRSVTYAGLGGGIGRYMELAAPGNGAAADTLLSGSNLVTTHIDSHWISPWLDQKSPAVKKRYRRPEFVLRSINAESVIPVEVRRDYDSRIAKRRFALATKPDEAALVWGDAWGEVWGGSDSVSPASTVLRGPQLGQARAVQIKVSGPPTNHHWGLNALTIKYEPRPPRS